jgi:hypothetical protein
MIRTRILAAILALGLLPGAASPPQRETITVFMHWDDSPCAGQCPDSVLTVSSLGTAEYRTHFRGSAPWRSFHYAITPAEFTAFRQVMQGIRPVGEVRTKAPCRDRFNFPQPSYEARWDGGGAPSRLVACYDSEAFRAAYLGGHRVLRIPLGGGNYRLSAKEASGYR